MLIGSGNWGEKRGGSVHRSIIHAAAVETGADVSSEVHTAVWTGMYA